MQCCITYYSYTCCDLLYYTMFAPPPARSGPDPSAETQLPVAQISRVAQDTSCMHDRTCLRRQVRSGPSQETNNREAARGAREENSEASQARLRKSLPEGCETIFDKQAGPYVLARAFARPSGGAERICTCEQHVCVHVAVRWIHCVSTAPPPENNNRWPCRRPSWHPPTTPRHPSARLGSARLGSAQLRSAPLDCRLDYEMR